MLKKNKTYIKCPVSVSGLYPVHRNVYVWLNEGKNRLFVHLLVFSLTIFMLRM
jgi:hypothetical protein